MKLSTRLSSSGFSEIDNTPGHDEHYKPDQYYYSDVGNMLVGTVVRFHKSFRVEAALLLQVVFLNKYIISIIIRRSIFTLGKQQT